MSIPPHAIATHCDTAMGVCWLRHMPRMGDGMDRTGIYPVDVSDLDVIGAGDMPADVTEAFILYLGSSAPGTRRSYRPVVIGSGRPLGTIKALAWQYGWSSLVRLYDSRLADDTTRRALSMAGAARPALVDFLVETMQDDRCSRKDRLSAASQLGKLSGLESLGVTLGMRAGAGQAAELAAPDDAGSVSSPDQDAYALAASGDVAALLALARGEYQP